MLPFQQLQYPNLTNFVRLGYHGFDFLPCTSSDTKLNVQNEDKYGIFRYEIKDMIKPWPGLTNPLCVADSQSQVVHMMYTMHALKLYLKNFWNLDIRHFILKVISITINDNFNYFIFNTHSFGLILECYFRLGVLEMNLFERTFISACIKKNFNYVPCTHTF